MTLRPMLSLRDAIRVELEARMAILESVPPVRRRRLRPDIETLKEMLKKADKLIAAR
jgi:hypothetical protein